MVDFSTRSSKSVLGPRIEALSFSKVIPTGFVSRVGSQVWGNTVRIPRGEFWHIVGPSGCGKTSLFGFLSGQNQAYSGEIRAEGLDGSLLLSSCSEKTWTKLRKYHLSWVFQDLRLIASLSIMDNLLVKATLNKRRDPVSSISVVSRIHDLAQKFAVGDLLDKYPSEISRGEQQRFCILRSLLQDFDFLIMDEPFSHLDDSTAQIVAGVVAQECQQAHAGLVVLDLRDDNLFSWSGRLSLASSKGQDSLV